MLKETDIVKVDDLTNRSSELYRVMQDIEYTIDLFRSASDALDKKKMQLIYYLIEDKEMNAGAVQDLLDKVIDIVDDVSQKIKL